MGKQNGCSLNMSDSLTSATGVGGWITERRNVWKKQTGIMEGMKKDCSTEHGFEVNQGGEEEVTKEDQGRNSVGKTGQIRVRRRGRSKLRTHSDGREGRKKMQTT